MGAQFSRLKVWVKEKLKVSDLNGEFNNILTNLTPAGIDDASVNAAAMQAVADPFPGEVLSMPTSTEGELRRLRFMLAAITGNTYWYEAPGKTIQELSDTIDDLLEAGQWVYEAAEPTYISSTQFSLETDRTADFPVGLRIRAAVQSGFVYGTVTAATSAGAPAVTTITAKFDEGGLDVGLSAIKIGILSPLNGALPILPVSLNAVSFALSKQDHGKTIYATSDTAIDCTLLAPGAVPSGWWVDIINIGAGAVTLVGTVEGVTDPALAQWGRLRLMSNGTVWTGRATSKSDIGLGNVDNTADANKTVSHAATATTAGSADSVADGSITQAKLEAVVQTAGSDDKILGFAASAKQTTSANYAKIKELQPMKRAGLVSITADLTTNGNINVQSSYRVYLDGVHSGATFNVYGTLGEDGTGNISGNWTVDVGTVITIWAKVGVGGSGFWARAENVVVKGREPIAGEVA